MSRAAISSRRPRRAALWVWLVALVTVVGAAVGVLADAGRNAVDTSAGTTAQAVPSDGCSYWVSPTGDDDDPGTEADPWATLEHAAASVADRGCTVWFEPGVYSGSNGIKRRFTTTTTFRSRSAHRAVLEHDGTVVDIDGGRNIVIEGFELRHANDSTPRSAYVAIVDRRDDTWSEHITFRGNVFHDSYGDDLLKIHNGVRFATVEGNVFYNQGEKEQQIDVNSVTDVTIRDNIFFHDFAASGRELDTLVKHFIVVKDSNEDDDGLEGSRRITIHRNVFLNWQGAEETFVQVGNDGKAYHEAREVRVENNLLIGNSSTPALAAFGVRGARDVVFNNNTVVGDLPSKAYSSRIHMTGDNPLNERITFTNNIWSDSTGTMGSDGAGGDNEYSDGDPSDVSGLVNYSNLYWNGDEPVPAGENSDPLHDDDGRVVADPESPTDQSHIVLPIWTSRGFPSGNTRIRDEFVRLVEAYGAIAPTSPAVDAADPGTAATHDILGRPRTAADVGAFEVHDRGDR